MKLRVYQGLVKSGMVTSKKEAFRLVESGRVSVNSKVVNSLDYFYDTKRDVLFLDGKIIKNVQDKIYLLFNKPRGIETTKENILKFLSEFEVDVRKTIFPVGRLDKDSEGLLILTNDGKLAELILEPVEDVEKTYLIKVERELSDSDLTGLANGIEIQMEENGKKFSYETKPCKISKVENVDSINGLIYEIKISEGKKRQIRRMLEAVGNKVIDLKRISIGKIELGDLKSGSFMKVEKDFIVSKLKPA